MTSFQTMSWWRPCFLCVACATALAAAIGRGAEDTVELPGVVVTATRAPLAAEGLPLAVDVLESGSLGRPTALTVDDALRGSPAFNLFRRTGSLTANPASQGVSLRGIGPSGASRSLVLLDGFPLNDPFGGWVAWSKVPRLTLGSAEIVRGGGSAVWGSAAIGGVVQMISTEAKSGAGGALFEVGEGGTVRTEAFTALGGDRDVVRVGGRLFHTDGWHRYSPEQRGAIDRPLDSQHWVAHADWTRKLGSGLKLSAGLRSFGDDRGNGTPYTANTSRETAARVALTGELAPDIRLQVLAYAQRQTFTSQFSSVNEDRSDEQPALDQYDVPSTAWGSSVVATWVHASGGSTTVGGDVRFVTGETREDYFHSDGDFLRRRIAGGEEWTGGFFAAHQRKLSDTVTLSLSGRVDGWRLADGRRREFNKVTGEVLRDDVFADRDGAEFSPGAGLVWRVSDTWRLRAATYRAFRVPTLNEFYRPFRVGSVATDANPALKNESLTGVDAGAEFRHGPWRLSFGVFQSELDDAVANVTLSATPEFTQRQRQNLERVRVRGVEAGVVFRASRRLFIAVDYLLSDATVATARVAPDIEGKHLPQVPRHTATLRASWVPAERWTLSVAARAFSKQYEDDLNALPLAAAATVDFAVNWKATDRWGVGLAVDNLLDADVETGRRAEGLVDLAPPRVARVSLRTEW